MDASGAELDLPQHDYNRALMQLDFGNHEAALDLLQPLVEQGFGKGIEEKNYALALRKRTEELRMLALLLQVEEHAGQGAVDEAIAQLDKALAINPRDPHLLFKKADLAIQRPNPFLCLETLDKIKRLDLTSEQRIETKILRAKALGRMNKVKEAIRILEGLVFYQHIKDARARELLAYYYIKTKKYEDAVSCVRFSPDPSSNAYLIAANASYHQKNYRDAYRYYRKAKRIKADDVNIDIGLALSLVQLDGQVRAMSIIDSLAGVHSENPHVMNARGVVFKDIGLSYRNAFRRKNAEPYLTTARVAFQEAADLSKNSGEVFLGNKALALFLLDEVRQAQTIWSRQNMQLTSQNNLALLEVSQSRYPQAYNRLDSLAKKYKSKRYDGTTILDHNRSKAKRRTPFSNDYKFLTYYVLRQDRPNPEFENLFEKPVSLNVEAITLDDYVLEYSDEVCNEDSRKERRKKRKKKRIKKRLLKSKKYKGDCPKF